VHAKLTVQSQFHNFFVYVCFTHAPFTALAEDAGPTSSMGIISFTSQGNSEMYHSSGALEGSRLISDRCKPGVISKLKVFSTDASNSGWGALYEGRPTFGLWSSNKKACT